MTGRTPIWSLITRLNQGLTVIARLGYVPEWARPAKTSPLYIDRAGYDAFARFAAAFATHFPRPGQVSHHLE